MSCDYLEGHTYRKSEHECYDLIYRFFGIWMVFVINIAAGVEGAAYGEDCSSATCDDTNNICDTEVALNKDCEVAQTASDQCSIANSECTDDCTGTDKCLCKANHYENGGACVLRIAALEDSCVASDPAPDECAVDNAECRTAKCQCKVTHYVNVAACAIS
ncbi:unnamed protein product [Mytilus edulis]|uniref:Uncharacterized protein n=1 Tax=Mytilus edulis TaxID=6550 RepID=A0A8S3T492_MYTED|nr:unnamed protein product [Mytilus edulis]